MLHSGTRDIRRRRRVCLAVLRGAAWNRAAAEMNARLAAAAALEGAAAEVRHGARDDRVRALVDRALRRLSLVADLAEAESADLLSSPDLEVSLLLLLPFSTGGLGRP